MGWLVRCQTLLLSINVLWRLVGGTVDRLDNGSILNTVDWFDNEDLIEFVQHLECQVIELDRNGTCYLPVNVVSGVLEDDQEEDDDMGHGNSTSNERGETFDNDDPDDDHVDLDDSADLELLPRDLSDLGEDISEYVTAGVEESLKMFGGNVTQDGDSASETRQLPMYLFQGQYVSEPRLNRFIDGALRNMGSEVRISSMDPIYFRVLPRGRVQERGKPVQVQRVRAAMVRGQRPAGGRRKRSAGKESINPNEESATARFLGFGGRRKSILAKRKLLQAQKRRQRAQIRRNKLRKQAGNIIRRPVRRRVVQNKNRRKPTQSQNQQQNIRVKQMAKRNVGGGRVEGLSRVARDGDAEMQLFGNYTLIRSHMKLGPVDLTMQFRTKKGIRRTGATIPVLRAHTVTRVNHEGSEMVDFLLDRPHPETIQLRGNLFPLASKIARNVFARLFLPDSFLIQRMREKTGLALLSKPTTPGDNYSPRREQFI